ncbi:MAG: hypothetical protein QM572_15200, partial [Nocardioides sp.]|uniref:hypothetical protein n=1 Tax=Nocardioides sp. TaxID=35761 RepID=UPI0039E61A63
MSLRVALTMAAGLALVVIAGCAVVLAVRPHGRIELPETAPTLTAAPRQPAGEPSADATATASAD